VSCAAVPELVLSRTGRTLADMQHMYDVAISRQVRCVGYLPDAYYLVGSCS
jgi:hypothetical protein